MTATTTMDWYRAKLDEAEKERDELAARVAELESEARRLLAYTTACEGLLNCTKSGQVKEMSVLLDRTQAASLARHDAELIGRIRDGILSGFYDAPGGVSLLDLEHYLNGLQADRIEQEASGQ